MEMEQCQKTFSTDKNLNEVSPSHTLDMISRVNVNNIYANLGGESTNEEDDMGGSDSEGGTAEASVVVKTTKSKRTETSTSEKQAFLAPDYVTEIKEESRQSSQKFRCQKFKKNNCSAGSLCLFSHDTDIPTTFSPKSGSTTTQRSEPSKSPAYDGVMFDLESGSFQASVEAQGKFICIGYFAEPSEAARARDIGLIRMIGFENSMARLCLDITNYDTIDVRELRSYDEILEDNGARLSELSDESSNLFGYRWLGSLKSSSSVIALGDTRGSQRKMVAQALPVLNDEDILSIKEMGKYQPDWVYEEWLPVDISRINTRHGRVSLSINFHKNRTGFRIFKDLISRRTFSRKEIADLPIWTIEIQEKQAEEDKIPGRGYCGFIAMDQILNRFSKCVDIATLEGRECVIGTIERLIGHEAVHPNGRLDKSPVMGPIREDSLALMRELSKNSHPKILPKERWMSGCWLTIYVPLRSSPGGSQKLMACLSS